VPTFARCAFVNVVHARQSGGSRAIVAIYRSEPDECQDELEFLERFQGINMMPFLVTDTGSRDDRERAGTLLHEGHDLSARQALPTGPRLRHMPCGIV
jgi:hypothetical protein